VGARRRRSFSPDSAKRKKEKLRPKIGGGEGEKKIAQKLTRTSGNSSKEVGGKNFCGNGWKALQEKEQEKGGKTKQKKSNKKKEEK